MTEPIKLPPIPPEWQGLWNNGDRPVYRDAHMQEYATLAVEQATAELKAEVKKMLREADERRKQHAEVNRKWVAFETETILSADKAKAEVERLRAERDHSRACFERASALIHGIHALLYPPYVTLSDGRTMAFRPSSLDPHEVLQELSDRIRALPDELAALKETK